MAGERRPPSDYLWARQVAALLLIGVVVVILVLDAVVDAYDARVSVLVPCSSPPSTATDGPFPALHHAEGPGAHGELLAAALLAIVARYLH